MGFFYAIVLYIFTLREKQVTLHLGIDLTILIINIL